MSQNRGGIGTLSSLQADRHRPPHPTFPGAQKQGYMVRLGSCPRLVLEPVSAESELPLVGLGGKDSSKWMVLRSQLRAREQEKVVRGGRGGV